MGLCVLITGHGFYRVREGRIGSCPSTRGGGFESPSWCRSSIGEQKSSWGYFCKIQPAVASDMGEDIHSK